MQAGHTPSTPDYFSDLQGPSADDLRYQLEMLVEQGAINPEEAQAILLEQSKMGSITLDPRLKEQQMASLAALQELASGGGMNTADQSMLSRIANQENAQARGQREAILQNAQARGLGGSGIEMLSNMINQQESVNRKSQRDLDVAAMAQQRALEAMMQSGQLAGQMSQQDFGQQSQIAQAQDAIARFNAQNQQNQVNMNVQNRNQAQQQNLANKQQVANANVMQRNQQAAQNANIQQQIFENELRKRGGQAGIGQANASAAGQNSAAQAAAHNQMMSALFGVGAAAAGGK
jgi:hypothetical protein